MSEQTQSNDTLRSEPFESVSQASYKQLENNIKQLSELNKGKHRHFASKFAEHFFPADLILDNLDNFEVLDESDVQAYAEQIDSKQPSFDPIKKVFKHLSEFDMEHYQAERQKNMAQKEKTNKTNKELIQEQQQKIEQLTAKLDKVLGEIRE